MKKVLFSALGGTLLFCGCSSLSADADGTYYASKMKRSYSPPAESAMADSMVNNSRYAANKSASGGAFFKKSDRMMAYTSGFTLTVKKQSTALDEIKKLAESLDGYLVSSNRGNMKLKVPVTKADEFLKSSGKYGKMSDFRISAEDLTDTITDLGVRLDNLRKLRTRLTELLKKAQKVEEMLKVERELNRITTEIERIDAQLQNNKNRVAFVTFEVAVIEEHGAIPSGTPVAFDRFPFLKKLASNDGGLEDEPLFRIKIPAGFVAVEQGARIAGFAATTSDDCIFRTWEEDIPAESTLEFWEKMVCRTLQSRKSFSNVKTFADTFKGKPAVKITAELSTARGTQLYMAVISVDRCFFDELRIVEFFGPQEAFKKHEKAVSAALQK